MIAQVKLLPDEAQAKAMEATIRVANAACEFVSARAWETKTFQQVKLHHLCYYEIREKFGLSAQIAVRVIAKVSDAYKLDKKHRRRFCPTGTIAYDDRILSWDMAKSTVSIWTMQGRLKIPFVCGERQRELLKTRQGESDLGMIDSMFFLSATCDVEPPKPIDFKDAIGVDVGIVNIAVDSDGEIHSGSKVNNVRHRYRRRRQALQKCGTRSAKRRLKRLSGQERRFAKDVNHVISKRIVAKAKGTGRAIALEDLKGIRGRVTVQRRRRAALHSWSFRQLRSFVEYKAERDGIPVILVDPRNTSRTCPACGHVAKANRPSQSIFHCVLCGFDGLADRIAAENIRRAAVNRPIVAGLSMPSCKPRTSSAG